MPRNNPEPSFGEAGDTRTGKVESLQYTWGAGIVGGIAGGICMGIILHVGANMLPYIGALYGWPTVIGGWIAHLVNSTLIGLLFALLVSRSIVREETTSIAECVVFGVVYAAAVGLVTGGVMLPVTMSAVGTNSFPEPLLPLSGTVGGWFVVVSIGIAHVVYGLILGTTYGVIHNSPEADSAG